ncbi:SusC/RagA family TonB-linked outer membrane protein [Galbibacter pacificus]|uniref:SusC/RagA family TonB-linked outer membrane protein n=1 Tax=Galbibacter pacificus TaxID=2996052 RepID=A0ABT6FWD0_9FLAO|nr:SusC/RagA family TonB-linked outer membrane protein [Galbibacter pacificus]MDG3583996.1 SusC/RagA family TonB-linked outer membrane protein [Galbibacter pacificus]MDG3587567.1 SusC/RagA family TonB-linked outer membrane protein [Galbibacter pacificus]
MKLIQKFTLLAFLVPLGAFAQQSVSGTVTEAATGTPIPGVNVLIKGSTKGTTTDFDGNFQMEAEDGTILQFSYIGFTTSEATVSGSTLNVSLTEDTQQLEEVVVIGYGAVRKKDVTGAVDLVSSKDFNQGPVLSPQQLIQGKVAGVSISSGGGAPGEGQNIIIRGQGSLSLSSSPLYVVDGIPLADGDGVGGSRNPLNFINPNDIESMTVLKDASATAIYGSRAANGVIMITTKKGKGNEFKFSYSGSTTLYDPTSYVAVMKANQFRTLINDIGDENAINRLGNSNTNWQDEIYGQAFGFDHNFSTTGNIAGFMPIRASVGYTNQDGVLKGDNFSRTTGSVNLRPSFLDDHLKIELNGRGSYTENAFANRDAIGASVDFDPTQAIYDPNSPFGGYFTWLNADSVQNNLAPTNPVALVNLKDDTAEVRRFIGNAKVDYKLHFFPDITATINVGIDKSNSHGRTIVSDQMPSSQSDWNGSFSNYRNIATNKLFDAYATYVKDFNDKNSLNAVVGYSYQSFEEDDNNYDSEKEEDGIPPTTINKNKSVLLSYFGRLNYNFDSRYLFTATLRADASSKLNPNDRWGYFPSFAFAWNINNEQFLEGSEVINELKLRIGYGEIGNVSGLSDYLYLTRYTQSQSNANYQFGNSFYQTFRPEAYNENLRWEVGNTLNAGIDYGILNRRISGSVNAYIKKTENLISNVTVDPFTNFSNSIQKNIGDMVNKGIEFELNAIPVQTDNFNWSIGYNISFNDNELTNLPDQVEVGEINGGTGNRIQLHKEGYAPYSFWVYKQVYDENGRPIEGAVVDRNGDNQINNDDRYLYKNPYADVIMGLNTNLNYKNWDLAVVTRANLGNYVYNNMASSKSYERRATENSILTNLHTDYYNTGFKALTEVNLESDYYVQNASFFKIDNITLGYTLRDFIENTNLRFYGSAQNVLIVTNYNGLDPEINGGIDNNFYPRPRSFVFGVNLNF